MRVFTASAAPRTAPPQTAVHVDNAAEQNFQSVLQNSASVPLRAKHGEKEDARSGSDRKTERKPGDLTGTYSTPMPLLVASTNPAYPLPGSGAATSIQSGASTGGDASGVQPGRDKIADQLADQFAAVFAAAPEESNSTRPGVSGQLTTGSLPALDETAALRPSSSETVPGNASDATSATSQVDDAAQLFTPTGSTTPAQEKVKGREVLLQSSLSRHGQAAPDGHSLAALGKTAPTQKGSPSAGTEQRPDVSGVATGISNTIAETATAAASTQLLMHVQHAPSDLSELSPQPSQTEAALAMPVQTSASLPMEDGHAQSDDEADQAASAANLDAGTGTKATKTAANGTGGPLVALPSPLLPATLHSFPGSSFVGTEALGSKPGMPQIQGHGSGNASAAAPQPLGQKVEAAPELPGITAARLLQSLSHAEMQIKVNSEDFGRVTIHAAYGHESIAAQITLENTQLGSALGSALAAHMPAIEQKLGQDHGLRASVTIDTQAQAGGEQGRQRQPDAPPARRFLNAAAANRDGTLGPVVTAATAFSSSSSSTARLDIRI